jgi:hypothetical protein
VSDRLFDIEDVPEVPIFREAKRAGAAGWSDERFKNDYPPEWNRCLRCNGWGVALTDDDLIVEHLPGVSSAAKAPVAVRLTHKASGLTGESGSLPSRITNTNAALTQLRAKLRAIDPCVDCGGMGSLKALVRLEAGHRCVRCKHPYVPKGDAKLLGVESSGAGGEHMGGRWSACDERCDHRGPFRWRAVGWEEGRWQPCDDKGEGIGLYPEHGEWFRDALVDVPVEIVESEWRILTVHHLDGDKANCRWWNLAALCQRCHLEIQGKVIMERVYPHEHSEWFRPYVAGYYAWVYLGEELTREQVMGRLDELLGLELAA